MAHFGFTKEQALSMALSSDVAKNINKRITAAIQTAVDCGLPGAFDVEVYAPTEARTGMEFSAILRTQVAGLEEDGFQVHIQKMEPGYAILDVIWGTIGDNNGFAEREVEVATWDFEVAYNSVRNKLRKELTEKLTHLAFQNSAYLKIRFLIQKDEESLKAISCSSISADERVREKAKIKRRLSSLVHLSDEIQKSHWPHYYGVHWVTKLAEVRRNVC